jgi:hypothetical protein
VNAAFIAQNPARFQQKPKDEPCAVTLHPYPPEPLRNILPEQTLGRGLRKMYPGDVEEYVSVVGTNAFMDFVESIQAEGVVLERKPMGEGTQPKTPLVVEVDNENVRNSELAGNHCSFMQLV